MDIESKMYRCRSMAFGGVEIEHKPTGYCVVREANELPSLSALSAMSERQFDQAMKRQQEA